MSTECLDRALDEWGEIVLTDTSRFGAPTIRLFRDRIRVEIYALGVVTGIEQGRDGLYHVVWEMPWDDDMLAQVSPLLNATLDGDQAPFDKVLEIVSRYAGVPVKRAGTGA